jgi:lipopolysaccharide biosynthesis regulator YciM
MDTGMPNRALADIRKAYSMMKGSGYLGRKLSSRIKSIRGNVERGLGNFSNAIKLYKEFMVDDQRLPIVAGLTKTYILSGDLKSAREWMNRFQKKYKAF